MEFIKVFHGLVSNDQLIRDENLKSLIKLVRNLPKANSSEIQNRKILFKKIWNSLFYCK